MTYRKWIVIVLAALAAAPAALAAQGAPRTPRAPRPPREPRAFGYSFGDNRGRIGVVVRTEADAEADKLGAKIEGVTPGGPAAKAGIKVGDIITKFNTTSLAGVKAEDEDESGPGMKLVELAHQLEPGDTVQIEYRRGNDAKKATLVAENLGGSFSFTMPDIAPTPMPKIMAETGFCFGEPWCDLDLVTLNPDLGEYFGAKEGVLVVKAPADSALPLRAGDVILKIGDRTPSSPSHAMKILRSYESGESVNIEIMRKQKRTTIAWKVPEPEQRRMRWKRAPEREDQTRIRELIRSRVRLQRV